MLYHWSFWRPIFIKGLNSWLRCWDSASIFPNDILHLSVQSLLKKNIDTTFWNFTLLDVQDFYIFKCNWLLRSNTLILVSSDTRTCYWKCKLCPWVYLQPLIPLLSASSSPSGFHIGKMIFSYLSQPSSHSLLLLFQGWYTHFGTKHVHLWDIESTVF